MSEEKLESTKLAISVKELQQMLGLSKGLCYSLIKRVDFPTIRIQGRIIIPIAELKIWLGKNCIK